MDFVLIGGRFYDLFVRIGQVDPEGDRTIGVLTKPDLVGPGNEDEAAAVLKNVRKPLKLGYVMVKCRSQRDIDQGQSYASVACLVSCLVSLALVLVLCCLVFSSLLPLIIRFVSLVCPIMYLCLWFVLSFL